MAAVAFAILAGASSAFGQDVAKGWQYGDGREYETAVPEFRGIKASVPIPIKMHIRNDGGSDGAGLCVIASNLLAGVYQDVPELKAGKRSATWIEARKRPGGYDESKLRRLWDKVGMQTPWTSVQGNARELCAVIEHYTRQGIPCQTTMNTGRRYGWQWIAHMVETIHLDAEWACVIDNNFPDVYFWMPRAEYESRLAGGSSGWVVVLLWRRFAFNYGLIALGAVAAFVGFLVVSAAVAVVGLRLKATE